MFLLISKLKICVEYTRDNKFVKFLDDMGDYLESFTPRNFQIRITSSELKYNRSALTTDCIIMNMSIEFLE